MRQRAESRERITQAAVMLNERRLADADRVLAEIPLTMTMLEGATVFRATGEWNALATNWPAASDRFLMLLRAGKVETTDHATLDHTSAAVSLLEENDVAGYERYRRDAVARFQDTTNAMVAERTVKNALLRPADKELLDRMLPLTQIVSSSITSNEPKWTLPWRAISMALFEYRRGRHDEAVRWAQRCQEYRINHAAREATVHAILAMAYSQLGQIGDARAELDQSRDMIASKLRPGLDAGNGSQGYWFDWVLARILMREAVTVLGETPHSLARPAQ
jgi:hypothetical protein